MWHTHLKHPWAVKHPRNTFLCLVPGHQINLAVSSLSNLNICSEDKIVDSPKLEATAECNGAKMRKFGFAKVGNFE